MYTLTQLLKIRLCSTDGEAIGRLHDLAVEPGSDKNLVQSLVFRRDGKLWQMPARFREINFSGLRLETFDSEPLHETAQLLFLRRDVLDQQIIDVNGRKVVRVNDIDLQVVPVNGNFGFRAADVEVGFAGALRRLFQGVIPREWLTRLSSWLRPRVINWEMFNLIETDPTRRVQLQINYDSLAKLHPADVADIVETLAPDEREAVFESLDSDVAAEILGEVEPKFQRSILQSLDTEKAADIVEEMEPDEAADLLAELPHETSQEILQDMEAPEREEVSDLLEFKENSAGGRMTTEAIALPVSSTVADAVAALRSFDGPIESVNTIFLVDDERRLFAAVPLARVLLAASSTPLAELRVEPVSVRENDKDTCIAETFDKYNLLTLPVVDKEQRLLGVITADDVISMLRQK